MKKLFMLAFVASLAVGCGKKKASCEDVFEHTKSLAPAELRESMDAKKDRAIEKCGKMSDEAKQCALDAKTFEDLQKCPRG